MKKFFILYLLFQASAWGSFSPSTIISDPGGVNQADVNSSHELNIILNADSNVCKESGGNLASILNQLQTGVSVSGTVNISNQISNYALETGGNLASILAKLNASIAINNFPATQPVSAVALPLPTNAAIETGGHLASIDSTLTTINTTLGSPFQAGGSIGNSAFGISGTLPAYASTPTFNLGTLNGAATNAELVTINSTLGNPLQAGGSIGNTSFGVTQITSPWVVSGTVSTKAPVNANGTFSGSLSVTTTEGSTAAPANAIGVVFEAESTNATNIRWGVSNSSSAILSTSSGVLMEPGRSVDFLPIGTGTFIHYISTAAGTNAIDIQWVLSQ